MSDQLKDQLEALVPPVPDTDFVSGARRHARRARLRQGLAGVATLAVIAVAVAVPLAMRDSGGSPVATTPDLPSIQCPDTNAAAGPDALGADPARARLCTPEGYPVDLLTEDLDALVSAVNSTEPAPADQACPAIAEPGWSIVFQYADGGTQTVAGQPTCGLVKVGSTSRIDSGEVLPAFYSALGDQRAHAAAPGLDIDVSCDRAGANTPLVGDLALTEAVLCRFDNTKPGSAPTSTQLSAAQLAAISADFNERAEIPTTMPSCVAEDVGYSIVGQNAWGDLVVMGGYCLGFMVGDLTWEPGPDLADQLGG